MAKKLPVIALIGRPNVGKSTLFNRLAGRRKAIVDNIPGVTRDRLFTDIDWEGRNLTIIDTGGFLPPEETAPILPQVIAQCEKAMEEADVIIFLTDARTGLTPIDKEIMKYLRRLQKPFLVAVNKIDSEKQLYLLDDFYALGVKKLFPISALQGHGIYELISEAVSLLPKQTKEEKNIKIQEAIKIALVGRPNVGKSSLFNRLIGDERSVVSEIPGTTRDTIDTLVKKGAKTYLFMDTAGLRRKSRINSRLERFSVKRALKAIENAEIAVVLLDAQEGITDQDLKIIGYALERYKCVLIAINKWDLIKASPIFEREYIEGIRGRIRFVPFLPILTISALTGKGVDNLFPLIDTLYQQYNKRAPTGQLNRFLKDILSKYQPPLYQNKPVKIYYATQVSVRPPSFVFFVNYPKGITETYKRFLTNRLRELDFKHIPLKLIFRERKR